eukprot:6501389-Lingulodinium_polyedra.AAC.1
MRLQSCSAFRPGKRKEAAPFMASEARSIAWSGDCVVGMRHKAGSFAPLRTRDGFALTAMNGASS